MHLKPYLAPYKVAVLPLMKKYHQEKATEIYEMLSKEFMTSYDETGNIGKFRIKTIDLVNDLEKEIKDVISTLETEASK